MTGQFNQLELNEHTFDAIWTKDPKPGTTLRF